MEKSKVIPANIILSIIKTKGWILSRTTGSHNIYKAPNGHLLSFPEKKEYNRGILRQKMKEIGYDLEVLMAPAPKATHTSAFTPTTGEAMTTPIEWKISEEPSFENAVKLITMVSALSNGEAVKLLNRSLSRSENIASSLVFKVALYLNKHYDKLKTYTSSYALAGDIAKAYGDETAQGSILISLRKQPWTLPNHLIKSSKTVTIPGASVETKSMVEVKEVEVEKLRSIPESNELFKMMSILLEVTEGRTHNIVIKVNNLVNKILHKEHEEINSRLRK